MERFTLISSAKGTPWHFPASKNSPKTNKTYKKLHLHSYVPFDIFIKKDSTLSDSEVDIIHKHPEKSVAITKHNHVHDPYILEAIIHHYERFDGSGYPDRCTQQEISQYASILGICDVFDALTNERPYK